MVSGLGGCWTSSDCDWRWPGCCWIGNWSSSSCQYYKTFYECSFYNPRGVVGSNQFMNILKVMILVALTYNCRLRRKGKCKYCYPTEVSCNLLMYVIPTTVGHQSYNFRKLCYTDPWLSRGSCQAFWRCGWSLNMVEVRRKKPWLVAALETKADMFEETFAHS